MNSDEQENKAWLQHQGKENGDKPCSTMSFKKGSRLSRLSCLEKIFLLLFVLMLVVLIILIILLVVAKKNNQESKANVCTSAECVVAAARIHSGLDTSVDPCTDFYKFACGGWQAAHVIPQDKSSLDTFSLLSDKVAIELKNLLEADLKPSDPSFINKTKNLYRSCLNMELINKQGDKALKEVVTNIGGWPITTPGWTDANFDFVDTLIDINKLNSRPIVSFYVSTDDKNSSLRVLGTDQPGFVMPGQKYYLEPRNDSMLLAYEKYIFGIAKLMGLAEDEAAAMAEVKKIVDFEIELAKVSVHDEERRDGNSLYNPITLDQIHNNYSKILDWKRYVNTVMTLPDIGLTDITDNEIIINSAPAFFDKLADLLQATPKRDIANYMLWSLVESFVNTQGDAYLQIKQKYLKAVYGLADKKARFRDCVTHTTKTLGLAVGQMFIKDNFDADAKVIADDMITRLQEAFNLLLEDIDWMDEKTRQVAREKNRHIRAKIGYPKEITNNTYLEEIYANNTYVPDNYFENVLSDRREVFNNNLRRLRETVDHDKWKVAPSTVNAYYNAVANNIMFPAGILQPPFFKKTNPQSLNYGAIGMVIGHEITHAFDDRGRQFDKNGNLVLWWSSEAIKNFKKKAQCIIDQYGNFTVASINTKLNGINTQGENIADNGGLKQSFRAYKEWVKSQEQEEPLLPGLNYTHDQLFFISFSQMWCNLMKKARSVNTIKTGVHSPGKFRVIGSAQNSVEFSKAFNCPADSYMNKHNKCRVW